MLSFIIPAHNEAAEIGRCLQSVFQSASGAGKPFEVIVVDDASTDQTAALAKAGGARVIDVKLRKISAVRNAGAKAAKGDIFIFVDADTEVSPSVVRAALAALDRGALGGGARVNFRERVSWHVHAALWVFSLFYSQLARWAAGCFFFARREAFEAVGGFDESLYASEEITLSKALRRRGPFVVVRESVLTSARKLRLYSLWTSVSFFLRFLRHGPAVLRQRKGLEWWYEGRRE